MKPAPLNLTVYRGANFGPVRIYCQDANQNAVNIAGWVANANARDGSGCHAGAVVWNLRPNISNGPNGEITLSDTALNTKNLPCGKLAWDLVLTQPNGNILGALVAGRVVITNLVTEVV